MTPDAAAYERILRDLARAQGVGQGPPSFTFGLPVDYELEWSEAARERLQAIPSFARGMVVKAVEAYARRAGAARITPELLADVRARWGSRFRPRA